MTGQATPEKTAEELEAERKAAEQAEKDRQELEQKVHAGLRELDGEAGSEEDESGTTAEDDKDASGETDTSQAGEGDGESDEAGEAAENGQGQDDPDDDSPTLPDAHRRSLKAYGWTDEDIESELENLGDKFLGTAEKIHQNRNKEIGEWAEAGRKARQQEQPDNPPAGGQAEQTPSQPTQQSAKAGKQGKLEHIDASKLKEKYGDDELIDELVGPLNQTIDTLNGYSDQFQRGHQAAQTQEFQQTQRAVESFFDTEAKALPSLYGEDPQKLSDEQMEARNEVLDEAYSLMVGRQQVRGEAMSLPDALQEASDRIAEKHDVSRTKQSVRTAAEKRHKGKSLKPSRRGDSPLHDTADEPKDRSDLEKRTRDRLASAFG